MRPQLEDGAAVGRPSEGVRVMLDSAAAGVARMLADRLLDTVVHEARALDAHGARA